MTSYFFFFLKMTSRRLTNVEKLRALAYFGGWQDMSSYSTTVELSAVDDKFHCLVNDRNTSDATAVIDYRTPLACSKHLPGTFFVRLVGGSQRLICDDCLSASSAWQQRDLLHVLDEEQLLASITVPPPPTQPFSEWLAAHSFAASASRIAFEAQSTPGKVCFLGTTQSLALNAVMSAGLVASGADDGSRAARGRKALTQIVTAPRRAALTSGRSSSDVVDRLRLQQLCAEGWVDLGLWADSPVIDSWMHGAVDGVVHIVLWLRSSELPIDRNSSVRCFAPQVGPLARVVAEVHQRCSPQVRLKVSVVAERGSAFLVELRSRQHEIPSHSVIITLEPGRLARSRHDVAAVASLARQVEAHNSKLYSFCTASALSFIKGQRQ